MDLNDYPAVKNYLYSLKYHGAKYGIDRMQLLSRALDHPERRFPVIHIAGTNGKGSVAAMLDAIYRAAGLKTGLFTSPHLVHQGERIQVNRRILSHKAIVDYVRMLKPIAEELGRVDPADHPSFFEFMTGMAFLTFAREQVDVALLEVGLGGELDATNVVQPELSVITSIGYDHTEILGETLELIARAKAGIIKEGRPVVIGRLPAEAEAEIRRVAALRNAPVHSVREVFGEDIVAYPETVLEGPHQRWNAATATLAARVAAEHLPVADPHISEGLATVQWAGRWDVRRVGQGKTLVFDAAHNEEGASALDNNLGKMLAREGRKPVIICGSLGERRARAVLEVVARYAKEIVLIRPNQPRASSWQILEAAVPAGFRGTVRRSTVRDEIPAPNVVTAGLPGETVVATGSIYLLGELMEALEYAQPVEEQVLQD